MFLFQTNLLILCFDLYNNRRKFPLVVNSIVSKIDLHIVNVHLELLSVEIPLLLDPCKLSHIGDSITTLRSLDIDFWNKLS
ncbi:hypothetical protein HanIR_Chr07g0309021 [Helianthus annuus]|nr:hypothetical protein HanIR_Chr07g0309021 [Helianthus annuus]